MRLGVRPMRVIRPLHTKGETEHHSPILGKKDSPANNHHHCRFTGTISFLGSSRILVADFC
jgi:hypothetical protein